MPANNEQLGNEVVRLQEQLRALDKRVDAVEKTSKDIYDLAVSVKLLAGNVDRMVSIQEKQDTRITALEDEPVSEWKTVKATVITSIVSAIIGGVITFIFSTGGFIGG